MQKMHFFFKEILRAAADEEMTHTHMCTHAHTLRWFWEQAKTDMSLNLPDKSKTLQKNM